MDYGAMFHITRPSKFCPSFLSRVYLVVNLFLQQTHMKHLIFKEIPKRGSKLAFHTNGIEELMLGFSATIWPHKKTKTGPKATGRSL